MGRCLAWPIVTVLPASRPVRYSINPAAPCIRCRPATTRCSWSMAAASGFQCQKESSTMVVVEWQGEILLPIVG